MVTGSLGIIGYRVREAIISHEMFEEVREEMNCQAGWNRRNESFSSR